MNMYTIHVRDRMLKHAYTRHVKGRHSGKGKKNEKHIQTTEE